MTQNSLSLPSFAKINWSLHILGKRADGYHEVRTVLQTISLKDELDFAVTQNGEISFSCDEPDVPIGDHNLIVRAAASLKNSFGVTAGVRVHLKKTIPTKAGLGGASSNAAVTLLALAHLWKLKASPIALREIAVGLGADVPFFLFGGRVLGTGTGTHLLALDEQNVEQPHLIVITPSVGVATAEAYAAWDSLALTTKLSNSILSSSQNEAKNVDSDPWLQGDSLKNDFESVIFDIEPEIRRVKETLIQAGAVGALLAGSGSSVFGIFPGQHEQQRALGKIKLEAGWRVFHCVTLSRNEYRRFFSVLDIPFLRSFNS